MYKITALTYVSYICNESLQWTFRLSSLNSALNFGSSKLTFCCVNVLQVCCSTAKQYSEITCTFQKFVRRARSRS